MHQAVAVALRHHTAGEFDKAAQLYDAALSRHADDPDALHLLGVLSLQQAKVDRAVELIDRAVEQNPSHAVYRANYSEALRAAGRLPAALEQAKMAVRLAPLDARRHHTLGLAWLALGDFDRAAEALSEAVRHDPQFALAHNNLGICQREMQRHAEALCSFRLAVRLDPSLASAHSNLGQQLLEEHRPAEALEHCRKSVQLAPTLAGAHNNLGNALRRLGRLDDARGCYRRALELAPNDALVHGNLGQAYEDEGLLGEAFGCYQRALTLAPEHGLVRTYLAGLYHRQGRVDAALDECRQALRLDPSQPAPHCLLGELLTEDGDDEGAKSSFRAALHLRPNFAQAQVGLGRLFAEQGAENEALESYRGAVNSDPRQAAALAALATHLRERLPDAELAAGQRLLSESLPERDRATLQFGVAHALDGRQRFAEAAELFRSANDLWNRRLVRMGQGYDAETHRHFVDRICEQFVPDHFRQFSGCGSESDLPVFVVGLPRSGTTLVEQILASHPDVYGAGELTLIGEACEAPDGAEHLLAAYRQLHPTALRIVDKMPDNLHYLGFITTVFPQSRIVLCRRDVRDVALSCWMTHFRQVNWAFDLDTIAGRIREAERVIDHWRRVLPSPMVEIDYEETVEDVERAARRLIDACGLPWRSECLSFHESKRPVRTASVSQVRRPVHRRSVGRWRRYDGELDGFFRSLTPAFAQAQIQSA